MHKPLFFLGIFILIFSSLVLASSGCFTYSDSLFYCQDLTEVQAQEECNHFDDCNLNNYYFLENSCNDLNKFYFCKPILCKSNCKEEFLGKCTLGAVPEGKEIEWCSSGCCRFINSGNIYCNYKTNKALCESEARNRNIQIFNFDSSFSSQHCLDFCQSAVISQLDLLNFENVSNLSIPEIKSSDLITTPKKFLNYSAIKSNRLSSNDTNFPASVFIITLIIIILSAFLYYWVIKQKKIRKSGYFDSPEESPEENFTFDYPLSSPNKRLLLVNLRHKKKLREWRRRMVLTEAKLSLEKSQEDDFFKLKKVIKNYEKMKFLGKK